MGDDGDDTNSRKQKALSLFSVRYFKDNRFGNQIFFMRLSDLKSQNTDEQDCFPELFQELMKQAEDLTEIKRSACILLYLGRFWMRHTDGEVEKTQRTRFLQLLVCLVIFLPDGEFLQGHVILRFPFEVSPMPEYKSEIASWQLTPWWETWHKWMTSYFVFTRQLPPHYQWHEAEPDWLTTARIDSTLATHPQQGIPRGWRLKNLQCMLYYCLRTGEEPEAIPRERSTSFDIIEPLLRDQCPLVSMVYVATARRYGMETALPNVNYMEKGNEDEVWHVPKLRHLASIALVKSEFHERDPKSLLCEDFQRDFETVERLNDEIPYDLQEMMVLPYLTLRADISPKCLLWCNELVRLRRMDVLRMILDRHSLFNGPYTLFLVCQILFRNGNLDVSGGCPYWVYRCLASHDPQKLPDEYKLPPHFWVSYHAARAEFILNKTLCDLKKDADEATLLARFGSSDLKKINLKLRKFLSGRFAADDECDD